MISIINSIFDLLEEITLILLSRGFLTNGESTKLKIKFYNLKKAIEDNKQ